MNSHDFAKHQERARARAAREISKRVALFRSLTTDEARAKLRGASPWERAALHRVLKERGEE